PQLRPAVLGFRPWLSTGGCPLDAPEFHPISCSRDDAWFRERPPPFLFKRRDARPHRRTKPPAARKPKHARPRCDWRANKTGSDYGSTDPGARKSRWSSADYFK